MSRQQQHQHQLGRKINKRSHYSPDCSKVFSNSNTLTHLLGKGSLIEAERRWRRRMMRQGNRTEKKLFIATALALSACRCCCFCCLAAARCTLHSTNAKRVDKGADGQAGYPAGWLAGGANHHHNGDDVLDTEHRHRPSYHIIGSIGGGGRLPLCRRVVVVHGPGMGTGNEDDTWAMAAQRCHATRMEKEEDARGKKEASRPTE